MERIVIGVRKEMAPRIGEVLKDDLVSRQSITTREAAVLGLKSELHLVFIEGTAAAIERARELFKELGEPLPEPEASEAFQKLRQEEERASVGMGMIFDS
ncbi:MAG: hypothetical protein QXH42_02665 [Thermoplasmata archaeon]